MSKRPAPTDEYVQEHREEIGRHIRAFREKKGYSQDELAEIMEVHRSTISKVEAGRFSITIDYLVRFSWYLDFDLALIKNNKGNTKV
jgi:transcriptional regulator with XRE-family HTH domain